MGETTQDGDGRGVTGRGSTILAAWGLALAAAAVRLAFAAHLPVFPDEAYYWVWSRHPAPAYFDHPPAIAFLIGGGTALLGDGSLGIRLLPVLAGLVAAGGAIATARHLGGAAAALWTSAILTCMPLAAAGLILATPDAPLLAALALACYALVRAVGAGAGGRAALLWWLAAGGALGAAFLSKYTAILLPMGVLLALLLHDRLRPHLRTAGPWAASALALLLFLPVVAWNARHGWVSFAFQLRHGLASGGGSALVREGSLVGGQLALASPILFVLMVAAVAGALRRRLADPARYLLAVTAAVFLGFFAWSALERPVEPNWPAPFYIPASVLLALAAADGRWRRWLGTGLALGAAAVAVLYVHAIHPLVALRGDRDPVSRAFGWSQLAGGVALERSAAPAPPGRVWIATRRYQDAAEITLHLRDHPDVLSLNEGGRPNQYDLWPGLEKRVRPGDALVLVSDCAPSWAPRVPGFAATPVDGPDTLVMEGRADSLRARCLVRLRADAIPRVPEQATTS